MVIQTINDMANVRDSTTQAAAVIQTIATIGELANGIPGDACEAAAVCISPKKIRNQITFQAIQVAPLIKIFCILPCNNFCMI